MPQPKTDRALCPRTGAFAQLTLTLCGQNSSHRIYWAWYCEDTRGAKIVRDVGTGILPEILLVVWQALLLPRVLYYIGQVCAILPAAWPGLHALPLGSHMQRQCSGQTCGQGCCC